MIARSLTIGAAALLASTSLAAAVPAVLLTDEATLVVVDTKDWSVTNTVEVDGVERLHGIDFRAADKELYGVDGNNRVLRINVETGAVEEVSTLQTAVPAADSVAVDFNPMADRLRIVSGTTNLRANIETGEVTTDGQLKFDAADANASASPSVVAVAYTNSLDKPEATAMYDIDTKIGLLRQTAPNDGTLATIGALGVEGSGPYAFDIHTAAAGENEAWLVSGGTVYMVNLETGATTEAGALEGVEGDVRDISVMPGAEM